MWFLVFGQIEEVFSGGQGTVGCKDNSNRIKNILIDNSFHTWLLILLTTQLETDTIKKLAKSKLGVVTPLNF